MIDKQEENKCYSMDSIKEILSKILSVSQKFVLFNIEHLEVNWGERKKPEPKGERMKPEPKEVRCRVKYSWKSNSGELSFVTSKGGKRVVTLPLTLPHELWDERNRKVLSDYFEDSMKRRLVREGLSPNITSKDKKEVEELKELSRKSHDHILKDIVREAIPELLGNERIRELGMIWIGEFDVHIID